MKVRTLVVNAGMKVTKNYSTVIADASLTVDLDEGENIEEVHRDISAILHNLVDRDIDEGIKQLNTRV